MMIRRSIWPFSVLLIILGVFALAPAVGFLSLMPHPLGWGVPPSPSQLYAVRETVLLLIGVGVLVCLIGVGAAWMVSLYDFPLRRMLDMGLILPLAFPTYLAAYVAVDALDFFGPVQAALRRVSGVEANHNFTFLDVRSLTGAILILSLVLFPYIYVPARIVFKQGGRSILEAAQLLGASGLRLFMRIGLPLVRPALIGGLVLAMLETLNDIGAVEHLGVSSLSLIIRDLWLNRGDLPGAARISGLLLLGVGALVLFARPHAQSTYGTTRAQAHPRAIPLAFWRGLLTTSLIALPVLAGFVLPTLFLLWRVWQYDLLLRIDHNFFTAAFTSLGVAMTVSCIVTAFGALLALVIRLRPLFAFTQGLAGFGYAIPGTVLVLALFPVLHFVDDGLEAIGSTFLLTGTLLGVLYALSVRFLTLGSKQAELSLRRLPLTLDPIARVHGYGDFKLAFHVYLPAMLPGLSFGAILIFIDTIKELPATILLRPLNFETLATRAYAKAGAGLFEHAALESLTIVFLSGVAAYFFAQKRT